MASTSRRTGRSAPKAAAVGFGAFALLATACGSTASTVGVAPDAGTNSDTTPVVLGR